MWSDFIDKIYIKIPEWIRYLRRVFAPLYVKIYLFFLLMINIFTWLLAGYIHGAIDADQIALHYSVDSGIDFYGDIDKLYIIPLLGFFIILINFLLYFNMIAYKDKRIISHILFTTSLLCGIILLLSIIFVYLINFR